MKANVKIYRNDFILSEGEWIGENVERIKYWVERAINDIVIKMDYKKEEISYEIEI
jgi:hypothetical protein